MNVRLKNITLWSALTLAVCCLCACNARKKNTALARQYTAFITRYNIHYNGDKHYVETLHDMETNYEDDSTRPRPAPTPKRPSPRATSHAPSRRPRRPSNCAPSPRNPPANAAAAPTPSTKPGSNATSTTPSSTTTGS